MNIKKKYENILNEIDSSINVGKFQSACDFIKFCANYKYFVNDIYCEDRLEKAMQRIASDFSKTVAVTQNITKRKVLFYDQLSRDNRVLSKQYLEGLIQSGYEIVYVYYEKNELNNTLLDICEKNNVKSYALGLRYNLLSLNKLINIYNKELPEMVFSQSHVDDYICAIFNYAIKQTGTRRLFINISDHTFWIGNYAYDKIIEFRNYGYTVSVEKRGVPAESLVKLPYYAADSVKDFQGLDEKLLNSKLIVSGGAIYKTQGKSDFFDVINNILDKDDNSFFLYLGTGAKQYVFDNIDTRFHNRVEVQDERLDLDGVLQHSYIYINTYPICGALMTLYAAKNHVIPFTICNETDKINDTSDFFRKECHKYFLFETKEQLETAVYKYLKDEKQYYIDREIVYEGCIKRENFNSALLKIMKGDNTDYPFEMVDIDYNAFHELYESMIQKRMPDIVFCTRNSKIYLKFPRFMLKGLANVIKSKGPSFFVNRLLKYTVKSRYYYGG